MKKLVGKSLLFGAIFGIILLGGLLLSTKSPHRENIAFWTESVDYIAGEGAVEEYIRSVQEKNDYTKLILGDSVCNQMFNDLQTYNEEYCIVGNNRGLTIAGEYLLFCEFIKNHENVTDVYLVVGLDALESGIDATFGYQYVVIPFSRFNILEELDDKTFDEMSDTFGSFFLKREVAQIIGESNVGRKLYFNYLKQKSGQQEEVHGQLNDTTVLYLEKMYQMCKEKKINLHLLPDPLADNGLRHDQAMLLQKEFERVGLSEYFPDYFSLIQYYPEEEFLDGVHFGGVYDTQEEFNYKIQELYMDAGYMKGLCLDFPLK